jgi:hypothetical protein
MGVFKRKSKDGIEGNTLGVWVKPSGRVDYYI